MLKFHGTKNEQNVLELVSYKKSVYRYALAHVLPSLGIQGSVIFAKENSQRRFLEV